MTKQREQQPPLLRLDTSADHEKRTLSEVYEYLAEHVVDIGDPDYRRRTLEDRDTIEGMWDKIRAADHVIWPEKESEVLDAVDEGFGKLEEIIIGHGKHSMLGKVLAVIAYCDVADQYGWPDDYHTFLKDAFLGENERGGPVLLSGALLARLQYILTDTQGGTDALAVFERSILDNLQKRGQGSPLEIKQAIHTVARVFSTQMTEGNMKMRLPWVRVTEGEGTESESMVLVGGYPDSVMFLGIGDLVSDEKLTESVQYGVPDIQTGDFERRLPRILVGVRVDIPIVSKKTHGPIVVEKRFVHIHLRAMRRPSVAFAPNIFTTEGHYKRENIMDYGSFDSLPYVMAVRLARDLRKKFNGIEQTEYKHLTPQKRVGYKENRKRKVVEEAVARRMELIAQSVRYDREGRPVSILSLGLDESQRIDGTKGWDLEAARAHVKTMMQALSLQNVAGSLRVRDEQAIVDLYLTHIWNREITLNDKFEMVCAILSDPKSPHWGTIPKMYEDDIVNAIYRNGTVDERVQQAIVAQFGLQEKLILRCETIRDKREPEGMKQER